MATKKKSKVRRTTRKKEQRAWIPEIGKFGTITQLDSDGTVHIQCDQSESEKANGTPGFRWFGPSDAIVTDADIAKAEEVAKTEAPAAPVDTSQATE